MSLILEFGVLCIGLGTMTIGYLQWRDARLSHRLQPALEATDRFFSTEVAEVRYDLYELLTEVARAVLTDTPTDRQRLLRETFGVDPSNPYMLSRQTLIVQWADDPTDDPVVQALRTRFRTKSAVFSVALESLFKAGEFSPEAARYIQERLGYNLVWFMLAWPWALDLTGLFMARKYLRTTDIANHPPIGKTGYTTFFSTHPLWDQADWELAINEYDTQRKRGFLGRL